MNSHSGVWWASLNEIPKARDLSSRKEIINSLGLVWIKRCIFLSTCYGSPITREKREKKRLCKIPSKWTCNWSMFKFLFLYIYADVNKRQIMEGKNSSDKIEEKRRGNIPRMINLRFWIRALPISLKESGPYLLRWRTVFSPSAI